MSAHLVGLWTAMHGGTDKMADYVTALFSCYGLGLSIRHWLILIFSRLFEKVETPQTLLEARLFWHSVYVIEFLFSIRM